MGDGGIKTNPGAPSHHIFKWHSPNLNVIVLQLLSTNRYTFWQQNNVMSNLCIMVYKNACVFQGSVSYSGIVLQYIGCIDTLTIRYISYHSFQLHDTSNDTFLLKFRIFWSLKFPSSCEICGYIKFFLSKTKQNVLLIHIEYHVMYHIA